MRVEIDDSRCEGHGRCYALAPTVFTADEGGRGVVVQPEVGLGDVESARLAIANCPESAIRQR